MTRSGARASSSKLRRPKRPQASKEEFLRAALELLGDKGFHETSMDDIVRRAGRSKGGFYHHFKSKYDLLQFVLRQVMRQAGPEIIDKVKSGAAIEATLLGALRGHSVVDMDNTVMMKAGAEIYLMALRDRTSRELLREFHAQAVAFLADLLEIGKARKELVFSGPSRSMAELIYDGSRGLMLMEVILNDGRHLRRRIEAYLRHEFASLRRPR